MSPSDYLVNGLLIALVVLQLRGRPLTTRALVLPLAIVAWAATNYLHGVPTGGNDLVLVVGGPLIGAALGTTAALLTRITPGSNGPPIARATAAAAALWVLGIGARMGFVLWTTHGGAAGLGRFSAAHDITSGEAWVAGLVLMALAEVVSRTLILAVRGGTLSRLLSSASTGPQPV